MSDRGYATRDLLLTCVAIDIPTCESDFHWNWCLMQFGITRPGRLERESARSLSRRLPAPQESCRACSRPLVLSRRTRSFIMYDYYFIFSLFPICSGSCMLQERQRSLKPVIGALATPPTPFPHRFFILSHPLCPASVFRRLRRRFKFCVLYFSYL